ncbi:uncharacterized protein NEMAJ01_0942 [Nematocida major]|uniref:uncharacterized protein n=1 Tax=Nematocida major TaxID=1912982 RepID=UPI0020087892|nr:uncharacterized protein NEMAJ01_0942 [Nematocida major]KAH9386046.1 hypothetical protein NEMAJ01_0942 [Nematocida major]
MEDALLKDGCMEIEKTLSAAARTMDEAVCAYAARAKNYELVAQLEMKHAKTLPQQAHSVCMSGGKVYVGTWSGDVFVYEDGVYAERFQPGTTRVVKMEAHKGGIVVVHADGLVSYVKEKEGVLHQLPGYIRGAVHPYNPWLVSQSAAGLEVFDFSHGKSLCTGGAPGLSALSIHPAGSCLLSAGKTLCIVDLRCMQVAVEAENILEVQEGLFHSMGVEMIVSARKKIKTIDVRNMCQIKQISTRDTATVLCEHRDSLVYSGPSLYTRSICPVTGKSLFLLEKPALHIASDGQQMVLIDSAKEMRTYAPKGEPAQTHGSSARARHGGAKDTAQEKSQEVAEDARSCKQ